ncbi:AraC family transcriptional regulator [Paenibacillus sp. KQZ6P-2]|uniref:AraC family transcriptional regulator n=1 Tax=Paenibacillus mangrovi TaxID=2931978 RepID=A0A9X2B3S8_9BACL|nr:AraC family transcriptional regulator [Paenibacillus mangrovi]MCJ8010323.1 AraC family transcriptional regulator [Paenibacillus mangrovi]
MTVSIHEHIRFSLFHVSDFTYTTRNLTHEAQPFFTFSFISEGSVRIVADGKTYFASTGDVMVHSPNIPFSVHANKPGTHMFINLALSVMDQVDFFKLYPLPRVITLLNPMQYQKNFLLLKSVWNHAEDELRDMKSTMLVFQLLYEMIESAGIGKTSQVNKEQSTPDYLAQVIPYIEMNLKGRLTREELAKVAHLNPVYFSRLFQKSYGITPMKLVQKLRMKRALQMLENSEYTIEFIAVECGFYDAAYFNRMFQRIYLMTPGMYRRQLEASKRRFYEQVPDV